MLVTLIYFSSLTNAEVLVSKGYVRYYNDCAACRGEVLTVLPSDLTRLSLDNRGHFPDDYAHHVVDGRELPPATRGEARIPI